MTALCFGCGPDACRYPDCPMGRKPLPAAPPPNKKLLLVGGNSTGKTTTITAHVVRLLDPANTVLCLGGPWSSAALYLCPND